MARILILIGGHLCTAPRPQKEADTLAADGHDVTVAGVWFDPELVNRDRVLLAEKPWAFYPVLDFQPGQSRRFWVRLQAYWSRQLFRRWHIKTPSLLGYGAYRLLQWARSFHADLTIVHSEAGLWVGQQLLKQGYGVGVDFEDWFSQDLRPEARQYRPVQWIADLESYLLQHCQYRLTPSQAMARAIAQHYQVTPPTVIYNVFPSSNQKGDRSTALSANLSLSEQEVRNGHSTQTTVRLHWFSQTIGPGRGLELLFQALSHLDISVEVHLRGHCSPSTRVWLDQNIPSEWATRVHVHPTVPNDELPDRIAENDIGLALEQTSPPSRNLTVTNKLFQYLQASLAVIATDTVGQREVFQQFPNIGHLVDGEDAIALATAIKDLACNPAKLRAAKVAARQAAETLFCWELESRKLLAATEVAS